MATVTAIGALIAVTTGAIQLRNLLIDEKPVTSSIALPTAPLHNVSVAEFASARPDWFTAGADPEHRGAVFPVEVSAEGLDGEHFTLDWQARDANTSQAIAAPGWARHTVELSPSRDPWHDETAVWVAYPPVERFIVVFRTRYEGEVLGSHTSEPLRIGRF